MGAADGHENLVENFGSRIKTINHRNTKKIKRFAESHMYKETAQKKRLNF